MAAADVIILGASGHGAVVADAFLAAGVRVLGFVDHRLDVGQTWLGLPVLGNDNQLPEILKASPEAQVFVAIGDNDIRRQVMERTASNLPDVSWATCIHPQAVVSPHAHIAPGAAVFANAVVQPNARVEKGALVNTGAQLDHDAVLHPYASLAPGAVTGGNVTIGHGAAVSIGASVAHGISIGAHTVVGAGAVVVRDLEPEIVAYGIPARKVRSRKMGDPYL